MRIQAGYLKISFSDSRLRVGKFMNWFNLFSHHFPNFNNASSAWSFPSFLDSRRCLFILAAIWIECYYLISYLLGQSFKSIKARRPMTFSVYFTNFSPFFVNGRSYNLAVSMLCSMLPCLIKFMTFRHFMENSKSPFLPSVSNEGSIIFIFWRAPSMSPLRMRILISYRYLIIVSSTDGTKVSKRDYFRFPIRRWKF